VCGNDACETGEACSDVECVSGCRVDCPVVVRSCPVGTPPSSAATRSAATCSGSGTCLPATGSCRCFNGFVGADCSLCDGGAGYMRLVSRGPCVFLPGAMSSCSDGVRSASEGGVDCGGVCEAACEAQAADATSRRALVLRLGIVGGCVAVFAVALIAVVRIRRRMAAADSELEKQGGFGDASAAIPQKRGGTGGVQGDRLRRVIDMQGAAGVNGAGRASAGGGSSSRSSSAWWRDSGGAAAAASAAADSRGPRRHSTVSQATKVMVRARAPAADVGSVAATPPSSPVGASGTGSGRSLVSTLFGGGRGPGGTASGVGAQPLWPAPAVSLSPSGAASASRKGASRVRPVPGSPLTPGKL
jgi:hypothetical protein